MSKISESETTKTDQCVEPTPLLETKSEEVENPLDCQKETQEPVETVVNDCNGKDTKLRFN